MPLVVAKVILLWLMKKKNAQLYVSTQAVLANRDIFVYDKKWSDVFLMIQWLLNDWKI